jgi:inosine-uridine nucleoside N-ribohydrolase
MGVLYVLAIILVGVLLPRSSTVSGCDMDDTTTFSGPIHTSYPSSRPKIILDTDPAGMVLTGLDVDDDLAILNALSLHRAGLIELMGITITGGNAPIQYTYPNALDLIRYKAGISEEEIGVYRGGHPLTIHTRQNLEQSGQTIPDLSSDATSYLIDTIMNADEKTITILCIGPLTNIAAAFLLEPRIAGRIERIVSMGGTLTEGLPCDLNIRTDPLAASIVWNDMNCKKIIIPIETCVQAAFGASQLKKVEDQCSDPALPQKPIACSLLTRLRMQRRIMPWAVNRRFIGEENQRISENAWDGFILWDLVALWAAIRPELFENWQYFAANLLPFDNTNILGYQGPQIDWSHQRYETDSEVSYSDNRHQVLIPLELKKENDLHDLILNHLWLPNISLHSHQGGQLSLRDQLGSLPDLLAFVVVIVLGMVVLLRGLR